MLDIFVDSTETRRLTGSGSTTVIFFSHPSAASPATQNILPNMLLSQSCISPVFTHLASESGFEVSKYAIKVRVVGNSTLLNGGNVESKSKASSKGGNAA